jgi:hypothetical protein
LFCPAKGELNEMLFPAGHWIFSRLPGLKTTQDWIDLLKALVDQDLRRTGA